MSEHRKNVARGSVRRQRISRTFYPERGKCHTFLGPEKFLFLLENFFSFQYLARWTTFKSYCSVHSLGVWTCSSEDLIGFLQSVYDRTLSFSSCYQHLSAVAHYYRLRGLVSPSSGPVVRMYMRGLKRKSLADLASVKRAKPLSR